MLRKQKQLSTRTGEKKKSWQESGYVGIMPLAPTISQYYLPVASSGPQQSTSTVTFEHSYHGSTSTEHSSNTAQWQFKMCSYTGLSLYMQTMMTDNRNMYLLMELRASSKHYINHLCIFLFRCFYQMYRAYICILQLSMHADWQQQKLIYMREIIPCRLRSTEYTIWRLFLKLERAQM